MAGDARREALLGLLEPRAAERGLDVVDIEVSGARGSALVRVYLDNVDPDEGPIDLEELSSASRWISSLMDETDPIQGAYTLEVSSPGLERPLRREGDYERFLGRSARVRMAGYEGRRNYTGTIQGIEEGALVLDVDGERRLLPLEGIARARLVANLDDL